MYCGFDSTTKSNQTDIVPPEEELFNIDDFIYNDPMLSSAGPMNQNF